MIKGNQFGKPVFFCGLYFTPVLTQFRLNIRETYLLEDLLLAFTGNAFFSFEYAIFINLESLFDSQFANCNVMGLGTGKIMQRRPIAYERN